LESLPTSQFAAAAFYIDLIADHGPLLREPYTRQLDGKLRELRFHLDGRAVRVTCWIAAVRRIVEPVGPGISGGDDAVGGSAVRGRGNSADIAGPGTDRSGTGR
jgi:hypothetical protein